jgi:putative transposase
MSAKPVEQTDGRCARYTYRLRVSAVAQTALLAEWDRCRWVWNQCVDASGRAHAAGQTCGAAALDKRLTGWRAEHEWLDAGASVPHQQVIRDFAKSRAKALKDIKNQVPMRRRTRFPKFKKKDVAGPTLSYSRNGFRLRDGRLSLPKGVVARPVWSRPLPGQPSSVRVYRDTLGHWYASFVVPARTEQLPATSKAVGVDWGVRQIATTTSDDHDLPHPQHGKTAAAKLARYQRMMARRRTPKGRPASRGYRAAARLAAKAHKKAARQRRHTARMWAKNLVTDFGSIAVEDFHPKFLAKSTMARKAADAAIKIKKTELMNMAAKHGRQIVLVDPKHTTRDCGACGTRTKNRLPLSQRTYTCHSCGHTADRDKNAAQVILNRAGLNPAGADGVRHVGAKPRRAARAGNRS